jgi:hypothetical protein
MIQRVRGISFLAQELLLNKHISRNKHNEIARAVFKENEKMKKRILKYDKIVGGAEENHTVAPEVVGPEKLGLHSDTSAQVSFALSLCKHLYKVKPSAAGPR